MLGKGKFLTDRAVSTLRTVALLAACLSIVTMAISTPAHAQQRSIVNTGFEQPGVASGSYQLFPDTSVPGWNTTDSLGQIEIWGSGFGGVPASEGINFAELNANSAGYLYQNVCMTNGEPLGWTFDHRRRSTTGTETAQFVIRDLAGTTDLQVLATQASSNNQWNTNSGTATYTGPTGIQRVGFRAVGGSSIGNFLDAIQIDFAVYTELSGATTSADEGSTTGLPALALSGNLNAPVTLTVTDSGTGTATAGVDYVLTSGTITVPAGNYNGETFTLPVTVFNDSLIESDETIILSISNPTNPEVQIADIQCGGVPVTTATHTITDVAPPTDLSLGLTLQPTGNATIGVPFSVVASVTNQGPLDATGVEVNWPVPAGYSLVEVFDAVLNTGTGDFDPTVPANYNSGSGTLTIGTLANGTTTNYIMRLVANSVGTPAITAEISAMNEPDSDSTPGNGIGNGEDDEGSVTPTVTNTPPPGVCQTFSVITGGAASLNANGEYIVTPDLVSSPGFLWSTDKIDLDNPFDIELSVYLGTKDANGADGMTFVLHNDVRGTAAQGANGGFMGVGDPGAVTPSLVIEFDTWANGAGLGDTTTLDHTAVYLNGNLGGPQLIAATPIGAGGNVENGLYHMTRYVWNPATNTLQYYFDGALIGTIVRDLRADLGSNYATVGFTGSTGGFSNLQKGCFTRPPVLVTPPADLSGTLYEDDNGSNTFNSGTEATLPAGISVDIYDDNGTPAVFSDDTLVTSVVTDAAGVWSVSGVNPALTYRIEVDEADPDIPASWPMGTPNPVVSVAAAAGTTTIVDFGFDTQPVFSCPVELHQVYGATGQIGTIDLVNNNFNNLPSNPGYATNAAGFRISDNYVYGMHGSNNNLVRYGSDGNAIDLGPVTGLAGTNFNAGDFAGDGYLHVKAFASNTFNIIDVDLRAVVGSYTVAGLGNITDFAWNPVDGLFYLVPNATSNLVSIAPGASTFTTIGPTGTGGSGPFGAMFADAAGNVYGAGNTDGNVYQFDTTSGAGTLVGTGASATTNDGFYCSLATYVPPATDLSLTKTASTLTPAVGESVTYTLTVTNNGPGAATNIVVSDLLPAGVTYDSDSSGGTPGAPVDYDPGNGVWTIGTIAQGTPATLDIVVTIEATGDLTNRAEIIAADLQDPDSDVTQSFDVDDLSDGLADDDEAELTLVRTGITVSGTVFADTGAGAGATAHNGLAEGNEAGLGGVTVEALQGGNVIASAQTDGDGRYDLVLPVSAAGSSVTLQAALADGNHIHISAAPGALPGLVDPDTMDGTLDFTPASGGIYTDVSFGQVALPVLTEGQAVTVAQGQSVGIAHKYTATSTSDVIFTLINPVASTPGTMTQTLYLDTDCSGVIEAGEGPVPATMNAVAGDMICLVTRVSVSSGASDGSTLSFDVQADTGFTGTAIRVTTLNSDSVRVSAQGALVLTKQVCNATISVCNAVDGTGYGASNSGRPGEVLSYRLIFTNPGPDTIEMVEVFDTTPAYASLEAASAVIIAAPAGLACQTDTPAAGGLAGYTGPLKWSCSGTMVPGSQGIAGFDVRVDQ